MWYWWVVGIIFWLISMFVSYSFGLRKGHYVGSQKVLDEWRSWINEQR